MHTPDDISHLSGIQDIYLEMGEDTQAYLGYLVEKNILNPGSTLNILNLACGTAGESCVLEHMFPHAHIEAIEIDSLDLEIARHDFEGVCTRTNFTQGNLFHPHLWETLPQADLILIQQPQISGLSPLGHNISRWLEYSHDKLQHDGRLVICLMEVSEVTDFLRDYGDLLEKYFTVILSEENPHGTPRDFNHLIVLKPKIENTRASIVRSVRDVLSVSREKETHQL